MESDGQIYQGQHRDWNFFINGEKNAKVSFKIRGLVGSEKPEEPGNMPELEAYSEMVRPNAEEKVTDCVYRNEGNAIAEVDLTADSPEENSPELSVLTGRRFSHKSPKDEFRLAEKFDEEGLENLSKLFDESLLAEMITEGT